MPWSKLHVGRNLLNAADKRSAFVTVPYVWSEQYGSMVQILGKPGDKSLTLVSDAAKRQFMEVYVDDENLVGIGAVNYSKAMPKARRAIIQKWRIGEFLDLFPEIKQRDEVDA